MTQAIEAQESQDSPEDQVVSGFAEFAAAITPNDVDDAAYRAAKRCLLDALGCAISAYDFPPVRALRSVATMVSSTRSATLIGTSVRTSPDLAAFVNGGMIRCLDFNDDYFGSEHTNARGDTGPHPSDNIGGVLAAAQVAGADGTATLLGIVVAYEVCGQLVDEVVMRATGWDHPIFHSIATSAAAGHLLGLPADRIADAVRLAVVPNLCVYETRVGAISNWKGLAGPNGSRNGMFATLLAEAGITGPRLAFEGPRGFMAQIGHRFALGPFGGAGHPFRIENTYFKQFALRYEMQLPVQLAFDLRQEVDPSEIRSLRVYMEKKSVTTRAHEPALWRPQNRETADHSGPYLIGAALLDGTVSEESFGEQRLCDPALLALVDTVELREDPDYTAAFPWRMSCRLEAELADGRTVIRTGDRPKGHPGDPFTDDEITAKFLAQAVPRLGADRAEQLARTVWHLEQEPDLDRLFDLLVVPTS